MLQRTSEERSSTFPWKAAWRRPRASAPAKACHTPMQLQQVPCAMQLCVRRSKETAMEGIKTHCTGPVHLFQLHRRHKSPMESPAPHHQSSQLQVPLDSSVVVPSAGASAHVATAFRSENEANITAAFLGPMALRWWSSWARSQKQEALRLLHSTAVGSPIRGLAPAGDTDPAVTRPARDQSRQRHTARSQRG